jgi:hypothetical protein
MRRLATPDITLAQIVAGIPVIAQLGHAFGLFDLDPEEQKALSDTVTWAYVLLGADAIIRVGRAIGLRWRPASPQADEGGNPSSPTPRELADPDA